MLDIEVDMEPPETFSAVLPGVPALPITVSFKGQAAASPAQGQEQKADQAEPPSLKPIASLKVSEAESNAWFEASDRLACHNLVWSSLYTSLGENPARWEALFELYDNRRNKSLSYDDFRELLEACGIEMEDAQFESICRDVDTDDDRLIEVQEFFATEGKPVNLPTMVIIMRARAHAAPQKRDTKPVRHDLLHIRRRTSKRRRRHAPEFYCKRRRSRTGANLPAKAHKLKLLRDDGERFTDYFKPYADPFSFGSSRVTTRPRRVRW